MRVRSRWILACALLLASLIITFVFNHLSFERTANVLHIMIGPRVTISYKHASDQHRYKGTHQSYLVPPPSTKVHILLWSESLIKVNKTDEIEKRLFPNYGRAQNQCPIKYTFSFAKQQERLVDGIIIDAKQSSSLPQRTKHIPWILYYDEPPIVNKNLENATFMARFNFSIGYRMDSDFPNPKISEPIISNLLPFHQKYDYTAAIFSSCKGVRTKYVQELSKRSRIKSYGDCLRNVEKNNLIAKGGKGYIQSKIRLFKMHKFALSLMKFDCQDYIDETLNHAWEAGTLPIYFGTDSLQSILPKYLESSFLPISQFKTPSELADRLVTLVNDKSEYDKFMAWRSKSKGEMDESPLHEIWNPKYSPGCQVALALKNRKLRQDRRREKSLKPITCEERSLDTWLGKQVTMPKVIDD